MARKNREAAGLRYSQKETNIYSVTDKRGRFYLQESDRLVALKRKLGLYKTKF